jgi:hypothetical protein
VGKHRDTLRVVAKPRPAPLIPPPDSGPADRGFARNTAQIEVPVA